MRNFVFALLGALLMAGTVAATDGLFDIELWDEPEVISLSIINSTSEPWMIIKQHNTPSGGTCLIDVNVWPHKWGPMYDYEKDCEFGEVIVHEAPEQP